MRNCTVDVDPDPDGVAEVLLMSCVVAAAFVVDAPLQHELTLNAPLPQMPPLLLNTFETSAVFDAFTEKPNCAFDGVVVNPSGYADVPVEYRYDAMTPPPPSRIIGAVLAKVIVILYPVELFVRTRAVVVP